MSTLGCSVLTPTNLERKIIGCGDGPASFNAELQSKEEICTSLLDPVLYFSANQIRQRIGEAYDEIIGQTWKNYNKFIWQRSTQLRSLKVSGCQLWRNFWKIFQKAQSRKDMFQANYPSCLSVTKSLISALCSYLLFLYMDNLSLEFHLRSLEELCRVSNEIRIFPLMDFNANRS